MVNVTIILHDYNDIWHACLWGNDSLFSLLQQHSVLISMHVKLYEVFMKLIMSYGTFLSGKW